MIHCRTLDIWFDNLFSDLRGRDSDHACRAHDGG